MDTRSEAYLRTVAARASELLGCALVGVYLHGSAVLGGFIATRSDIDLLIVVAGPIHQAAKNRLIQALAPSALHCPARGLELSVVTRATTLNPTPSPAFELHLATARNTFRVVDGGDHPGDPDLLLHFAVCREYARPLLASPPPPSVFAPVPRGWVLSCLIDELTWAEEHATTAYQVLNACRAWRFADERVFCSKLDGGRWAGDRWEQPGVVDLALDHQEGRSAALPDKSQAAALLHHVVRQLRYQQSQEQAI